MKIEVRRGETLSSWRAAPNNQKISFYGDIVKEGVGTVGGKYNYLI
jgi:hypothetical protein